ncbi:MAG: cell division protein FtsZ [Chloroflexi bacterium]|nr:cell division protein FtsZ [Chloroflexota bacterium]
MAKQTFASTAARIKCVGCGGGGCNAITRMVREGIRGVDFVALNTDAQSLSLAEAPTRIQLGPQLTRGLGAGGDHTVGARAADESREEIRNAIGGADMVFIAAGMGGGTGTGSAPVVAALAKEMGALTIGVVTKPFSFEGAHRHQVAEEGIANFIQKCDTLIIIPNDKLLSLCDAKTAVDGAFKMADDVLRGAVGAIAEVITVPGLINLDFADVRSIMKGSGPAWMSIGAGTGQNRAVDAARSALSSPLLDVQINGAKGVLFTVAGGSNMTLFEVNEAAEVIAQAVDPEANIIFGVNIDPKMENQVKITLIATGFVGGLGQQAPSEQELRRLIKGLETTSVDLPSFMRRGAVAMPRPQTAAQPASGQAKPAGAPAMPHRN